MVGLQDGVQCLYGTLKAKFARHDVKRGLDQRGHVHEPDAACDEVIQRHLLRGVENGAGMAARCHDLARQAQGGLSGAAFNAAKETALDLFVEGQLGFTAMASLVETVLDRLSAETRLGGAEFSLDDVLHIDTSARILARRLGEGKGLGNK